MQHSKVTRQRLSWLEASFRGFLLRVEESSGISVLLSLLICRFE